MSLSPNASVQRTPPNSWGMANVTVARLEMWQSLGYESFGEWRRASERARRAAKKAATLPAASVRWQPPVALPAPPAAAPPSPPRTLPLRYLNWTEYNQLDESARAEVMSQWGKGPAHAKGQCRGTWKIGFGSRPKAQPEYEGSLPGQLHEEVIMTVRGRRKHRLTHQSPGGTARHDEYISPAGVQKRVCEQRSACWRRLLGARCADRIAARIAARIAEEESEEGSEEESDEESEEDQCCEE